MLRNKSFITFTCTIATATLISMGLIYNSKRTEEQIMAHSIPSHEYTLQHAAIDMEGIHNRLVQSTETLQQVAQDFTTLVNRLEEKQSQQLTATTN